MSNALIDQRNYITFPTNNKSDHKSRKIIDVSKVLNLTIVEIDLNKILNEMQKNVIYKI